METLLTIMEIIALACVSILSLYIMVTLAKVKSILSQIEHDIKEVTAKMIPVFENLDVITTRVRIVTANIQEQVETVGEAIQSFKGIADSIVEFQQRLQEKVQEPVFEAVNVFTALIRGIRGFVERVRG